MIRPQMETDIIHQDYDKYAQKVVDRMADVLNKELDRLPLIPGSKAIIVNSVGRWITRLGMVLELDNLGANYSGEIFTASRTDLEKDIRTIIERHPYFQLSSKGDCNGNS